MVPEHLSHWHASAECRVLHLLHREPLTGAARSEGGGVEHHVADLVREISAAAHWSLIALGDEYHLNAHLPDREREFRFAAGGFDLPRLLDPALFDVVHVHHVSRFPLGPLSDALRRHGNFFVSLHEFHLCCPRKHLLTPKNRHCTGNECAEECGERQSEVESLRRIGGKLLAAATKVFHFSSSTQALVTAILGPRGRWRLLEHGCTSDTPSRHPAMRSLREMPTVEHASPADAPSEDRPLRIAFVGMHGIHKGAELIRQIVRRPRLRSGIPAEWHLIGGIRGGAPGSLVQHGPYRREELATILDRVAPDLVAILSICPETYCCTLDETLSAGVPVVVTPLGAPPERVLRHHCGWLLSDLTVESFFDCLDSIVDSWDEYHEVRQRVADIPWRSMKEVMAEYRSEYILSLRPRLVEPSLAETLDHLSATFPCRARPLNALVAASVRSGLRLLEAARLRPLAERLAMRLASGRIARRLAETLYSSKRAA